MARKKSYQRGSVREHPPESGVWTLRYREFNHVSRKWITRRERLGEFKSPKLARQAAEPIMARVNERNNSDRPKVERVGQQLTFSSFVAGRWSAYIVSAKHQPSTRDHHASLIKCHMLPFFGQMILAHITPSDISDFLQSKCEMSLNTQQNLYGLLRLMFDIAAQYDLIEHSPVRPKLHKPDMPRVEKPTLTAEQIRQVLAQLSEDERLFALLIAVTGMRMGEAMALRWVDFDPIQLELTINHTIYRFKLKSPKTEGSKRTVRLVPALTGLLSEHRSRSRFQSPADFIFCRKDGRPLNQTLMRSHLYKAMDRVGIVRAPGQYGFHIFRHSAGTLLYASTRDLKLVQSTLGHADISTTSDIYVHLDDKVIAEGTEVLAREILGNCDQTVTQESRLVS